MKTIKEINYIFKGEVFGAKLIEWDFDGYYQALITNENGDTVNYFEDTRDYETADNDFYQYVYEIKCNGYEVIYESEGI